MCDAGFTATFTETDVRIFNREGQCILTGTRNLQNRLLDIQVDLLPTASPSIHNANGIVRNKTTKTYLVRYHHGSLGNPTSNAPLKGIKQSFLSTFPGLDEKLVTNHLPPSIDTAKGHLQQEHQGLQSTKLQPKPVLEDTYTLEVPNRTKVFVASTIENPTGKSYGDLTGQYPTMSSSGNQYILVIYDYDPNTIIGEPLKSFRKGDIMNVYWNMHKQLNSNGYKPQMQTLDNEYSDILIGYNKKNKIYVQLAPPHMHRRNLAECAICTFK